MASATSTAAEAQANASQAAELAMQARVEADTGIDGMRSYGQRWLFRVSLSGA